MNNKMPLEMQFPTIDILFWDLLESGRYTEIPETSGTIEKVNEDEEALLQALRDRKVSDEIIKKVSFDLSTVSTCAALYGEEKGFILGYIHGAKMASDLANGYNLLQLNPDSLKQKQDESDDGGMRMNLSEHEKRVIIEYRKGDASLKAAINKLLDLEEPRPNPEK